MAGTVTGEHAQVWIAAHSGTPSFTSKSHSNWGIGDFSLTFDRGTVEQNLIGERGNYFDQGALSCEGSLTAAKFATSGLADILDNLLDNDSGTYKYLAISGTVSTDTDATYLSWYLRSCQVTGYDISIGDADTITEASIDFQHLLPQALTYKDPCIMDS
jgi:hypothetical protein